MKTEIKMHSKKNLKTQQVNNETKMNMKILK